MAIMKELSEYLKSERLQRGRTLKEISGQVRVSVDMLQALEEGDLDRIGTSLLIRSFIRAYCTALEIDPLPLLEKYDSAIRAQDIQEKGIHRYGVWMQSLRRRKRFGVLLLLILAILLAVAIYGGFRYSERLSRLSLSQQLGPDANPQHELPPDLIHGTLPGVQADLSQDLPSPVPDQPQPPTAQAKQPEKKPQSPVADPINTEATAMMSVAVGAPPERSPPETTSLSTSVSENAPKRFEVEAHELTWIQVRVDDKAEESLHLLPGQRRAWEARKGLKVVVGNGGGVRMWWEGNPLEIPCKSGSVLRFRLPEYMASSSRRP